MSTSRKSRAAAHNLNKEMATDFLEVFKMQTYYTRDTWSYYKFICMISNVYSP